MKYFVKINSKGVPVPNSLVYSDAMPRVGRWYELIKPCRNCDGFCIQMNKPQGYFQEVKYYYTMDEFCHPIAGSNVSAYCRPHPGRFMEYFPTCLIKPCQIIINNYVITYNGPTRACHVLYTTPDGSTSNILINNGESVTVCAQVDSIKVTCGLEDFEIAEEGNCPTTTTTTSSTTTTTTIPPISCYCYIVELVVRPLTQESISVHYTACDGTPLVGYLNYFCTKGPCPPVPYLNICAQEGSITIVPVIDGSTGEVSGGTSPCTLNEQCIPPIVCYCYNVALNSPTGIGTVSYTSCDGDTKATAPINSGLGITEVNICAQEGTVTFKGLEGTTVSITGGTNICTVDGDCEPLGLRLGWDDIAKVPVGDPTDVNDWNTFFNLPTNGTPFTSVEVIGNEVKLIGGANIILSIALFSTNPNIEYINDESEVITYINNFVFSSCTSLNLAHLPVVTHVGNSGFEQTALTVIYLPLCITLGINNQDQTVLGGIIANNITLTISSAVMNAQGPGLPDGDIDLLLSEHPFPDVVTIITV